MPSENGCKEREKLTNLGMAFRATLISHFERRASVEEPKVVRKQKTKRPYV
jgi:hypothetical protein